MLCACVHVYAHMGMGACDQVPTDRSRSIEEGCSGQVGAEQNRSFLGLKLVTTCSNWAKTSCLSIPSGLQGPAVGTNFMKNHFWALFDPQMNKGAQGKSMLVKHSKKWLL